MYNGKYLGHLGQRRNGYYNSPKVGIIYCDSSYELRAATLLDADDNVLFYETHNGFKVGEKQRFLDFLTYLKDQSKKIIEIKPKRRLLEFQEQIEDNRQYANSKGYKFEIWSEQELGFDNEYQATKWADEFLSKISDINLVEIRRKNGCKNAKKHYYSKIATDTINVFCPFCKEEHTPLRQTYEKAIVKNGRYICEKEGGHIAGSKPKLTLRKINPYAVDGKKQCNACKEIKTFSEFSPDKTKSDGYSTRCKICRAAVYKAKYQNREIK